MTINSGVSLISKIGGFASSNGAEIPAFDPGTKRLFVVAGAVVEVLDLADPTNPVKIEDLALNFDGIPSGFSPVPNSVTVGKAGTPSAGIVAVSLAIRDDFNNQEAGQVQFFDATTGAFLGKVLVGFLPDMVTFSPDGTKILTANEGEPNESYTVDPVGSVSIVDITGGFTNLVAQNATFDSFNGQKAELQSAGVRLFGQIFDDNGNVVRESTVAEDVEPEYIAFNGDGTKAWVTLQENNSVALVDIATATVEAIVPLGFKDHNSVSVSNLETFEFTNLPAIGTTTAGQEILLGGFSGLFYEGTTANGNLKFVTHTDRGPNGEPTGSNRPFLLPDFSPEIIRFELNPSSGAIAITQRLSIEQADGTPITGLPNLTVTGGTGNTTYNDEVPVDLFGNTITPLDNLGADLEGIAVAGDGTFWMVDEYRPAIYHFDTEGKLIDRFVPVGTAAAVGQSAGDFGDEVLPAVLAQRRQNRGFEAIALNSDTNKLYAFVQSPLRNPETLSNSNLNSLNNIRIVEFDLASKTVTAEYLYRMDNPNLGTSGNTRPDKIGDAAYIGNGEFLVLERDDDAIDSDPLSNIEKKVYRFSLDGATNITGQNGTFDVGGGVLKSIDQMTPTELATQGISLVGKVLHVDLALAGYNTVEKIEGLALIDADTIAVLNDNDFQVAGITIDTATGTFTPDPDPEPLVLGIISLKSNGLDASDRDGGINIQNWPIFGIYMPDSIASFTVGDQTYYITANEGDARNRPSGDDILPPPFDGEGDIFIEEARIKDLILDPIAFPNAAELQADENLGRLTVTTKFGDIDGDGDFDQLYTYGSRSFSIWDSSGNLVYDSGEDFEQIIAEAIPDFFNASNDNNDLDNRSDNKGPEPEGVTVGTIDGRTYAFVGLERIGGVMVYDVTTPQSPEFVQYINPRDFTVDPESNLTDSGPEGLIFINAADSPNGKPLLVVSNEVSNTTAVFEVNVPTPQPFRLQLFHAADQEGGVPALDDAPRFSAVLNALLQQDIDNNGIAGFTNNLILSSGDAYIPGLFFNASQDVFGGPGRADILIQNELGFQAIAFGNHEFDLGTGIIADLIGGDPADNFPGANFPYLSGNLDFTTDGNLSPLITLDGQEASTIPGKIAASTVITVNGEKIGIVGATTPTLRTISSPGNVGILPSPFGGTPTAAELDALAAIIQADVDALLLANPGLNKVVLLAHMQQIAIEQELASRLSNVDIIVAGGSNTRLVDENDRLRAGDTAQGIYPIIKTGADGKPVAVVNTDGNYKYVGRLVIDFDAEGVIIPESYDPLISGAYATDAQGVADLNAAGLVDQEIQAIVDQLREVIVAKEGNVFGISNVYLEGSRPAIRQQETNLGNLTADANLAIAKAIDPTVVISLKNGGGIRDDIGQVLTPPGGTGEPERLPNEAVTDAEGNIVKPEGGISETDVANALSFNNGLSLITVTAAELLALVEHGVAASDGSNQQGRFPQVSGFAFSFDLNRAPGDRVLSLAIEDETGKDLDVLVKDGELVGDASRTFRMVTLGFLATGGDGYPFPSGDSANLVDLNLPADAVRTGLATFAPDGSEQDALAEYLAANFNSPETAFNQADTSPQFDTRIQNLAFREDNVIDLTFEPIGTFTTPQLIGLNGYFVDPIFTVGEADPNTNYAPPGILDGLGAFTLDSDTVRVLANHELSANVGYVYQLANGTSLTGARVSYFDINTESLEVEGTGLAYNTIVNRAGEVVDSPDDLEFGGLNRLCSAQYIEAGQFEGRGLVDAMFFTGEETDGGTEYVLDPVSQTLYAVPWMGVAAWESVTELDTGTTDKVALLIGDDRGGAPLLLYVGEKGQGQGPDFLVRNGLAQGKLYAWVAGTGETTPQQFNGTGQSRGGAFKEIEHYRPELAGTDGYDALGFATQAKQDALAAQVGAFQFSRPEDLATSPTDGTVAVLASTGRDSLFPADSWGTTYLLDFDFSDLTNITADINVIYDGDDAGAGQFAGPDFGLRSPDNLEWADDGQIYLQEDRSFGEFGLSSGEEASIWRLDPNSGILTRVGQINRDAVPEGQTDSRPGDIGNWESSGIVDVSSLFDAAPGTLFLFDVQAHSLRDGIIEDAGLVEGGQLAFLRFGQTGLNEISTVAKNGLFFVELPNGMEVSLKYEDQPLAAGTFGNWQILEAETVGGVNQVLWQNSDTNQFGLWSADADWNWLSSETWTPNSFKTLAAEVAFQIDLNNDQLLGDRLTNVETKGNVSLLEGILGNYYAQTGDSLTTPIKYLGEVFDNNLGNWQALAAETVQGVNQVLWQNLDTNQIGVWNSSADWNWISSNVFEAGSPEAIAQAEIFGIPTTVLTAADSVLV